MQNNMLPHQERGASGACLLGSAWALHAILDLDEHNVGFLRAFLLSGPIRQKIIKAVVAGCPLDDPRAFLERLSIEPAPYPELLLAQVAQAIRAAPPHALLAAAFGSCPQGFLPGIARCHFDHKASFGRFHALFDDAVDRQKLKALAHNRLTDVVLDIVDTVPPPFLRPKFVASISNAHEAQRLKQSLEGVLDMCPGAITADRLKQIEDVGSFRYFLESCLRTVRCQPPIPGDNEMIPLQPGDLKPVSIQFHNCLRSDAYLLETVAGRLFFYRTEYGDGAIAVLRRLDRSDVWLLWEIHGPRNQWVAPILQDQIREWFADRGVPSMKQPPRSEPLQAIGEFMNGDGLRGLEDYVYG